MDSNRVWMISSVILTFSFYHQYIEQFEPCTLCKWQQFVYFLIFAISPIGLISRLNLSVRNVLSFIFLMGLFLSTYHIAVQFEWLTDRCIICAEDRKYE